MSGISLLFAVEAENLLKEGKVQDAIDLCIKGLESYPDYPAAHIILAKAYDKLGDTDNSLKTFQNVSNKFPLQKQVENLGREVFGVESPDIALQDFNISGADDSGEDIIAESIDEEITGSFPAEANETELSEELTGTEEPLSEPEEEVFELEEELPSDDILPDFEEIDTNEQNEGFGFRKDNMEFPNAEIEDIDQLQELIDESEVAADVESNNEQIEDELDDLPEGLLKIGEEPDPTVADETDTLDGNIAPALEDIDVIDEEINISDEDINIPDENIEPDFDIDKDLEEQPEDNGTGIDIQPSAEDIEETDGDEMLFDEDVIEELLEAEKNNDYEPEPAFTDNESSSKYKSFLKDINLSDINSDTQIEFNASDPELIPGFEFMSHDVDNNKEPNGRFNPDKYVDIQSPAVRNILFSDDDFSEFESREPDMFNTLASKLENASISAPSDDENSSAEEIPGPASRNGIISETMAEIYVKQGAVDEAIKAFEQLAEAHPDKADKFLNRIEELRSGQ